MGLAALRGARKLTRDVPHPPPTGAAPGPGGGLCNIRAVERDPAAAGTDDELELMSRVAAGDGRAFAAVFDLHSPVVLGVLIRLLRNRSEAEEVLQDVFLQVWRDARRYRPSRATPRGWMLMLARSRAIDRLRSRHARVRREERQSLESPDGGIAGPAAPERLEQAERRQVVGRALAELPDEQRLCIELAYYEGLSHSQIAERLATPLGTIKSRLLLGMRKLRAVLGDGR